MTVWRKSLAGVFVVAMLVAQLGQASTARAASAWNVDSWIELSTTSPASGCLVESAIEVRRDGYAQPGVDVFIGLYVYGELISSDNVSTDDYGIAYLAFDPSLAEGEDAWVDVTLNDTYWWGTSFSPGAGDSCYDSPLKVTESGPIAPTPGESEESDETVSTESTSADTSGGAVVIPEVGFYVQQRNLSCEFAAIYIATAAWGYGVSEYSIEATVGYSDNPHVGFRGNINGWWGNTYDYGVYPEPLSWGLAAYGFVGEVAYTGGDPTWLMNEISAGNPVLVWLGLWGDTSFYENGYKLVAGYHLLVAYGYDDGGVYMSDPATGGMKYYDWGTFIWMWGVMDGMGLSVYPA